MFKQRFEGREGVRHVDPWGKTSQVEESASVRTRDGSVTGGIREQLRGQSGWVLHWVSPGAMIGLWLLGAPGRFLKGDMI